MMENGQVYTLITGASSGIGRATAKAFAARGKNLILIARREEQLKLLQREILEEYPQLTVVLKVADLSAVENLSQLYDELRGYEIKTWINNAGFGSYASVAAQEPKKIAAMLHLNVEALTLLSSFFVRDYHEKDGAQLINISSCGGYTIVPTAVTYCASKFYVSAFTEGLAHELKATGAKLQAKVLAPAATKTAFGKIANDVEEYDYDKLFGTYHTSEEMAQLLLKLYDSDKIVGLVDRETFEFHLQDAVFPYAGGSKHNQAVQ